MNRYRNMRACAMGAGRRTAGSILAGTAPLIAALAFILASCGPGPYGERYAAEKKLYKVRRLRDDLFAGGARGEFLARAIEAYRAIVREHGSSAGAVPGMDEIVVSAQMELAEIEYRGGLSEEALSDYEKAAEMAANRPAALASALYSAGSIAEELGFGERAIRSFERFTERFLAADSLASFVRRDPSYLDAPLKLAELESRLGNADASRRRLEEAKRIYSSVIRQEENPALLRETRHNLLAAYLQSKDWARGLAFANELKDLYRASPADLSSLAYLEARIYEDGLNDPVKALALYESVVEDHPKSSEAPYALVASAGINAKAGRLERAAALYEKAAADFRDEAPIVVEAQWQLAQIEELRGDFESATLRYRSLYSDHPETARGLEAPLRIAIMYRERGAIDAAKAAFGTALDHYERLLAGDRSLATKIATEKHIIRALIEDKQWRAAAERMTALLERYPEHLPFREYFLRAASIYEKELGDTEGAIAVLERCIVEHPESELAGAARKELERLKR